MKNFITLLALLITFSASAQLQVKPVSMHPWVNGYLEYTPPNWDKKTKLPLVVYIHGIGETFPKKTLAATADISLPLKIKQTGMPFDCIVFMPQLNRDWPGGGTIQSIIDWAIKNYPVDTNRVYLTGVSMGGGSILDWVGYGRPSSVAAMLPVCPASWFNQSFAKLYVDNKMPIRFYHALDDNVVSYSNSKVWVDGLIKSGANPLPILITYDNGGHSIWARVYEDDEAWIWLSNQNKGGTPVRTIEAEFFFPGGKYVLYSDKTWSK